VQFSGYLSRIFYVGLESHDVVIKRAQAESAWCQRALITRRTPLHSSLSDARIVLASFYREMITVEPRGPEIPTEKVGKF
jgi:hypothetical protein